MGFLNVMLLHADTASTPTQTDVSEVLSCNADIAVDSIAGKLSAVVPNNSEYRDLFNIGNSLSLFLKKDYFTSRSDLSNFSANNLDSKIIFGKITNIKFNDAFGQSIMTLEAKDKTDGLSLNVLNESLKESEGRRVSVSTADGGNEDNSIVHLLVNKLNQDAQLTGADEITISNTSVETSSFPEDMTGVEYPVTFKPYSEVFKDMASGRYSSGDKFTFFIDHENVFYWKKITSETHGTLQYGVNDFYNLNFEKKVFGVYNAAIFNAGVDFNGQGIFYYAVDFNGVSEAGGFRWTYLPDINIAKQVKQDSGVTIDEDHPFGNASEYAGGNIAFRTYVRNLGRKQVEAYLTKTAFPRWKGEASMHGTNSFDLASLYSTIINKYNWTSSVPINLRCTTIQHSVGFDGWYTTLSLEENALEGL